MVDQTTTVERPKKEAPEEETAAQKPKPTPSVEPEVSELEKQIEVLEPVAKVVERKLKLGEEEAVFIQHEMSFFSKIKFFRLMSLVLRKATEKEGAEGGGIADFIQEAFIGAQQLGNADVANVFLDAILRLVEEAPDFLEEVYLLALNVKPQQTAWVLASLEEIDDEEGLDILEVFIAQNGKAISDFFSKRLGKLSKRIQEFIPAQEPQDESETTT